MGFGRMLSGLLLVLALTAVAAGKECKGVDFPDHMQVAGTDLTLNGLGMRKATFLKINVYVGALYVATPSHDPNALIGSDAPQELILQFVRGVGVGDLRKAWVEGFEHATQDSPALFQKRIATLNSWMSDMKTGDRLIFIRKPREGIQVSVNTVVKGTIEGDDFSRALLTIWLGPTPPNPELKSGLLGGACD
jgi:hypothetical protein